MDAQIEILRTNMKEVTNIYHQLMENYKHWLHIYGTHGSPRAKSRIKSLIRIFNWEIDDNRSFIKIIHNKGTNQKQADALKGHSQVLDKMANEIKVIDDQLFGGQMVKGSVDDFENSLERKFSFWTTLTNYKRCLIMSWIICILIGTLTYLYFSRFDFF